MKAFVVYWHPEPRSFNAAMFQTACAALAAAGHEVRTSDLHDMRFDPVSSRKNFTAVKDPNYLKPQIEEMNATERKGFAEEIESEIRKIEWCELMIWQFPLWWFGLPAVLKGWVDRVLAMGRTRWQPSGQRITSVPPAVKRPTIMSIASTQRLPGVDADALT